MDILEEKQLQANCSASLLPHGGTNDLLQYIVLQHEGQRADSSFKAETTANLLFYPLQLSPSQQLLFLMR